MRLRHCRAYRRLFAQPQPTQRSRSVTEPMASEQFLMDVGGLISMTVKQSLALRVVGSTSTL